MTKLMTTLVTIVFSAQAFASQCVTESPRDLFYCNEGLPKAVEVLYFTDMNLMPASEDTRRELVPASIKNLSDIAKDPRFVWTVDDDGFKTEVPEGQFLVGDIEINGVKFSVVHWADIDDSSYTLVYDYYQPHDLVYLLYEN